MKNQASVTGDASARFWDRYINVLHKQGITEPADRWHVKRAEQYIAAHAGKKLVTHTPEDVNSYLDNLGRRTHLKDWQFVQAVDAIQNLLRLAGVGWIKQVDWQYWRQFSRQLPSDHATIAREQPNPAVSKAQGGPASGLTLARQNHDEVLTDLIKVIRGRHYSIRTEQAYEQWACRFD